MEKAKALVITDVIREPRSLLIRSEEQMKLMPIQSEQAFELELQDYEGMGRMYALLTYPKASQESINHALSSGAKIIDVWVLKSVDIVNQFIGGNPQTKDINTRKYLRLFFDTCQPFCFFGDYKGQSYLKIHDYRSCIAIFSAEQDAVDFNKLIGIIKEDESNELKVEQLLSGRNKQEIKSRYVWDYEME